SEPQEGLPDREALLFLLEAGTSETRYLAVTIGSRDERANGHLRAAVATAAPPRARVLRSRAGLVSAVYEAPAVTAAAAREEAESLRRRVSVELADERVSAGVAGPKAGTSGAYLSLLQAEQTLAVGRALRGDGSTTHFDDLGPYCFVLGQPAADIRAFADRMLGPLAVDARHAELVRTLEAYLRLHGSVNAVARQLSVHRNTVRQRLRRIARLTRADLGDADARLALQLAILSRAALERLAS
ncbi:MAG: PucR family transcriptional regulator, partial [Candidatus Limnocylindria bacterium]